MYREGCAMGEATAQPAGFSTREVDQKGRNNKACMVAKTTQQLGSSTFPPPIVFYHSMWAVLITKYLAKTEEHDQRIHHDSRCFL